MAAGLLLVRQYVSTLQRVASQLIAVSFLLSACWMGNAVAAEDRYHFSIPEQEKRYQQLLVEIRCMVCENQSIAESNAPLAEDLRLEVYRQVVEGKKDAEIKAFLVERYGSEILYEPPIQTNTLLLWTAPIVLLIIGLMVWLFRGRATRKEI